MNCPRKIVVLMVVCLAGAWAVEAQLQTKDRQLFTLPPKPAELASAPANPGSASAVPLLPYILNFDRLPGNDWFVNDCNGHGSGTVAHGILTINSPSDCYEYILVDPRSAWNLAVNNSRGWIVEANLKVEPATEPSCDFQNFGSQIIWANDNTNLIIFGFSTNQICIVYPEEVHFAMNTTDSFHIYRIYNKGRRVRIYVDGQLAIDHVFTVLGRGSAGLSFGDGTVFGTSLVKWDYLSYDVFPVDIAP